MIQLKVRTEYSFGQTFAPLERVIQRLRKLDCVAAGMVDGSSWGHQRWFDACTSAGIRPLLGAECVVNDEDIAQRMWFLAKSKAGLSELYRFLSRAHLQRMKTYRGSVPRLYQADVEAMSDEIFKFAGEVQDGEFLSRIKALVDFSPASATLNHFKQEIAEKYGLWTVRVSDNAYAYPEDKQIFEAVSRAGVKVTPQHILDIETTEVSRLIVEACAGLELPKAPVLEADGDLETLCCAGAVGRFGVNAYQDLDQVYIDRLNHELDLIRTKNFESYFLIVSDMCRFAKEHMLVGPSRGSAAGSLVCYLLRITEIDPIKAGLSFERFLDPDRNDPPDIDLDFPDNKRQLVFDYMAQKYGVDCVAHIGTISQFRAKSALKQVTKALGIPESETKKVSWAMTDRNAKEALKETDAGKAFLSAHPEAECTIELEGHASHTSTHAAGLLVTNDEIANYAVIDDSGIAHLDKRSAEALGLLKIDVLGLRTLSVLEDSGVDVDWYKLPLNDPEAFDVLNSGRLCGIFQFEGNALRGVAKRVNITSIDDIADLTSLARPGPLSGGATERYLNAKGEHDIFPETRGVPIYQEQVMALAEQAGISPNAFRRAIGKKTGLQDYEEAFVARHGEALWRMVITFGGYGFNRSHAYAYAAVSYWCAWLKAHHLLAFAAATLRNAKDEAHATALLRELDKEGIGFTPFSLEHSQANWTVHEGRLLGGFTGFKGIGEKKAAKLIEARDSGTLTEKQRAQLSEMVHAFSNIWPLNTLYADIYDGTGPIKLGGTCHHIEDFEKVPPHRAERIFIGEVVYKKARNANEEENIKKRGGKKETPPLDYVDLRFRDDTGEIGGRVSRFDFARCGQQLLREIPEGAHLLVRAAFYNNYRYAFIKKWRRLDS